MSRSNPIHYIEVNTCGPHKGFDGCYAVVFVRRAHNCHDYWIHQTRSVPSGSRRYWRGIAMLQAFTRRLFPSFYRSEVVYAPNR